MSFPNRSCDEIKYSRHCGVTAGALTLRLDRCWGTTMSRITLAAVAVALGTIAGPAGAANLLANGGFETGNFSGWSVADQAGGSGAWFVTGNGAPSAINGFAQPALAGGGSFSASTDQTGPGSHSLSQTFAGVAGTHYTLSFDARATDLSGVGPVGFGTDYTDVPNQHVQLTISSGGETLIYYGILTTGWDHYSFDITDAVQTDGIYTLAFTEVDNQSFLNEGLDNVSLVAGGVPEPATWALMLLGFGAAGLMLRRRPAMA
jgi:hypothetical protein